MNLNPDELLVLKYIREEPRTVREIVENTGMNRTQVYRQLISLQWLGYAEPINNIYPQKWKYVLGAEY